MAFDDSGSLRSRRSGRTPKATSSPAATPPTAASRNSPSAPGAEKSPPLAAAIATVRMVRAVASFSRPSPWISVISRGGRPTLRPTESEPDADQERGGQHEQHRQADHGPQVAADRGERGVQRRAVEQRRQDDGQHQLGLQDDVGAGQERVGDADQGQQRRGGQAGSFGHPAHGDDDGGAAEDQQQHRLGAHRHILPDGERGAGERRVAVRRR
jgi:hypothetical protein